MVLRSELCRSPFSVSCALCSLAWEQVRADAVPCRCSWWHDIAPSVVTLVFSAMLTLCGDWGPVPRPVPGRRQHSCGARLLSAISERPWLLAAGIRKNNRVIGKCLVWKVYYIGYSAQMTMRKMMMRYFCFAFATGVERQSFVVFFVSWGQLNYAWLLILYCILLCHHWGGSKLLFLLLLKIN